MDTPGEAPALPQKAASLIAAPIPLPSIVPSLLSTSTVAGPSFRPAFKPMSKPASTAPIDIDPQSQAHADTLARHGIKVRDYAYESKLPPVRPYRVRQIQPAPGPRPLKRVRMDGEDDDVFYNHPRAIEGEGRSSKRSKLEREVTEPDIQLPTLNRARGFLNLIDYEPEPQSQSQQTDWEASHSQPPSRFLESQDSEPYIDTPFVTPNGSLQWKTDNKSDIPASQLDIESQANDPESSCMPQLADTTGTGLFGALTPMSSLSSIASDIPTSPIKPLRKGSHSQSSTHAIDVGSPLRDSSFPRSPNTSPSPPTPPAHTSRYKLRTRAPPKSPVSPTTTAGTRNRRTMYSAAHSLSRPIAYSMQSTHSRTKTQTTSSSSRPRTLRKRAAGPSSRDETMIVR
ncbi:hypothetical protein D9615_000613 [Tricholomella constricta]|uniref:Uncharacterized protein n=1 Tax=Tricholomella constricta TaxID=117010 RepID=A0A8H5MBC9_9AGAR|nr:hypothetical protein D9615_000613 [Tricholomella constricta]